MALAAQSMHNLVLTLESHHQHIGCCFSVSTQDVIRIGGKEEQITIDGFLFFRVFCDQNFTFVHIDQRPKPVWLRSSYKIFRKFVVMGAVKL